MPNSNFAKLLFFLYIYAKIAIFSAIDNLYVLSIRRKPC
jgi:hypothetical protein